MYVQIIVSKLKAFDGAARRLKLLNRLITQHVFISFNKV